MVRYEPFLNIVPDEHANDYEDEGNRRVERKRTRRISRDRVLDFSEFLCGRFRSRFEFLWVVSEFFDQHRFVITFRFKPHPFVPRDAAFDRFAPVSVRQREDFV